MRGNARRSGPRSVPRESALMTPEPVILTSTLNLLQLKEREDQQQLCLRVTLHGAPVTGAE